MTRQPFVHSRHAAIARLDFAGQPNKIAAMENPMTRDTDILVSGAGPTGMAAALEAAAAGFSVVLAAPSGTHLDDDGRTTALMRPGIDMLESYGAFEDCRDRAAPLKVLRIVDSTGRLFRAPPVAFAASEAGYEEFGFNIPNLALNAAMARAVAATPAISVQSTMVSAIAFEPDHAAVTLADGSNLTARLVIGADGANSLVREAAGIGARRWAYPQTAVVLAFDHERPHENISTEFHRPEGPFTQVPLPGNRSSLVWVTRPALADDILTWDDMRLCAQIETMMGSMLGKVSNPTRPQVWPLSSMVADRFGSERVMLVGQAAHVFPPIGAQGLNLGFRDVSDIAACLARAAGDPGSPSVTSRYDRMRRLDVYARTGAVDILNRSLLSNFPGLQIGRAAGLSVLRNVAPLRGLVMREGIEPGAGLRSLVPARAANPFRRDRAEESRWS